MLDDLYYYPGKLGVVFHHGDERDWHDWADDENCDVKLKVWAPTAQSVSLQIFDHESDTTPSAVVPMHEHNGVWVADGDSSWKDKYYLYSVQVWVPSDAAVDTNVTSDPYSIDIALNGTKSRITDLDSDETEARRLGRRYFAAVAELQRHERVRASCSRLQHQRSHRSIGSSRHV